MTLIQLLAKVLVIATLSCVLCIGRLHAQTPASNEQIVANVTVFAVPGDTYKAYGAKNSDDEIVLTYRRVIPRKQAYADLIALDAQQKIGTAQFIDAQGNGISNVIDDPASVQITASGVFPVGATHFDIEPFIIALKQYKRIRLIFASRPNAAFHGLRDYSDPYVRIDFVHTDSTYVYFVTVNNPNFTRLNLPLYAEDPVKKTIRLNARMVLIHRIEIGIILVLVLVTALFGGFAVYANLKRVRTAYNKS